MAYEVYAKDCVAWWKAQVGKDCGKTNEYSAFMDKYKFYNYPKNGSTNSCAIFYDTGIMKTMTPEPNANAGRAILCEPNVDNCGAGCQQKVQYYKQAGRWYPHKAKGCPAQVGDEVFFQKSNGAVYHTGAVVDWDSKGIYTVEGNTNGGKVAEKFYAYSDPKLYGYGRPKWTGYERPKQEEKPEPIKPEPTPSPVEPEKPNKTVDELAKEVLEGKWGNGKERAEKLAAAGYSYQAVQDRVNEILGVGKSSGQPYKVVNVNSFLRIRSTPSLEGKIIGRLANNDKVNVYKISGNWAKISKDREEWCSMDYLKKI